MKLFKSLIFIFLFLSLINKTFSQDSINWSPDYYLKWEDFKGNAPNSSKYSALSYIGIKYNLKYNDTSFKSKVACIFYPKQSWTKSYDSLGLTHEQGHFNIAELFARKLRKAFKNYKFNSAKIRADFKSIYNNTIFEQIKMDSLYDKETNFSRNKLKQVYWNKKILSELKKFEDYKE